MTIWRMRIQVLPGHCQLKGLGTRLSLQYDAYEHQMPQAVDFPHACLPIVCYFSAVILVSVFGRGRSIVGVKPPYRAISSYVTSHVNWRSIPAAGHLGVQLR